MSAPVHRPRSVSELIDVAIAMVRRHFAQYCLVGAVCLVPAQLVQALLWIVLRPDLVDTSGGALPAYMEFLEKGFTLVAVTMTFATLAESLLAAAVAQTWDGRDDVDVSAALRVGVRRWLPALFSVVVKYALLFLIATICIVVVPLVVFRIGGAEPSQTMSVIAVVVAMLLGGLAALPVIARLAVVPVTAILEPRNPIAALWRSNQLTRGLGRHAIGASALAFLVAGVPYIGASLLASATGSQIVERLISLAASVVLTPVYVACLVALYYDLRIRKEGFDLELMASRLATAVPDAGPDVPMTRGA